MCKVWSSRQQLGELSISACCFLVCQEYISERRREVGQQIGLIIYHRNCCSEVKVKGAGTYSVNTYLYLHDFLFKYYFLARTHIASLHKNRCCLEKKEKDKKYMSYLTTEAGVTMNTEG